MSGDDSRATDERTLQQIDHLKQQMESMKQEVQGLKTESKSWIRTWGVYLGILASVFAVPKGAKEAYDSFVLRPKFSVVEPVPLTLFYDAQRKTVVFSFQVLASNYGNRGGVIIAATAHLEPPSVDATAPHFKFVDESRQPIDIPFPIPVGVLKSVVGSAVFTGNGLMMPGKHRLDVTLIGDDHQPLPGMPMRFCFELSDELVAVISQESQRFINPVCE